MKRKIEPVISERVCAIRAKLEQGERLTKADRELEVSRDEAAFLLSAIAGRQIKPDYIKQITRGEKARLSPSRAVGNTYLFTVESLLGVRFTKAHKEAKEATEEAA
jgi:hypothetical protein